MTKATKATKAQRTRSMIEAAPGWNIAYVRENSTATIAAQLEAYQARIAELEAVVQQCERALSHNSLEAMSADKLAMARNACRVALGRHEAVEAARAALAKGQS